MSVTTIKALGAQGLRECHLVLCAEQVGIEIGIATAAATAYDEGLITFARQMLLDMDLDAERLRALDLEDDVRTPCLALLARQPEDA